MHYDIWVALSRMSHTVSCIYWNSLLSVRQRSGSILVLVHNAAPVSLDVAHIDIHMHTLDIQSVHMDVYVYTLNVQMINNTNVYLCVTLHHANCLGLLYQAI